MGRLPSILAIVLLLAVQGAFSQDLSAGLVHYWKLDGTTADETCGCRGRQSGRINWIQGVEGKAAELLGGIFIEVGDYGFPAASAERTISLAANPASDGSPHAIFSYGDPKTEGSLFSIRTDRNMLGVKLGETTFWAAKAAVKGWTHVVVIVPAGSRAISDIAIYLNGARMDGAAIGGKPIPVNTSLSGIARIGVDQHQKAPILGAVDEIRIYNRALSVEEIVALYQMYRPAIEATGDKG
jgi:hypothetical protein